MRSNYGVSKHLGDAEKAVNSLLRRSLRLEHSTPSAATWWEMKLPTISDVLESRRDRWTLKLGALGRDSTLQKQIERGTSTNQKGGLNDIRIKWKPDDTWDPREIAKHGPRRGHRIEQPPHKRSDTRTMVVMQKDTTTKGWKADFHIESKQETRPDVCGTIRTGEFTTAKDAEIEAVAHIIRTTKAKVDRRVSTDWPTKLLTEATTSLDASEEIREAVRRGKARISTDKKIELDAQTRQTTDQL